MPHIFPIGSNNEYDAPTNIATQQNATATINHNDHTVQVLDTHGIVTMQDRSYLTSGNLMPAIKQNLRIISIHRVTKPILGQQPVINLYPAEHHRQEAITIVNMLTKPNTKKHFFPIEHPNSRVTSKAVLDNYLELLDPDKCFFTSDEIEQLRQYQDDFLPLLARGDLHLAFSFYNAKIHRIIIRCFTCILELKSGIDEKKLRTDKVVDSYNKNSDWIQTSEQQQQYWLDLLYSNIIKDIVNNNGIDTAIDNQLKKHIRIYKEYCLFKSDEVFKLAVNSLATLYYRTLYKLSAKELATDATATNECTDLELAKTKFDKNLPTSEIISVTHDDSGTVYKVGVIKIPSFDYQSEINNKYSNKIIPATVKNIVDSLTASAIDGFIIDLRDNPGGSKYTCIDIIKIFLEKFSFIVVSNTGENIQKLKTTTYKYKNKNTTKKPLLCLVNQNSASSSEIFANTIQLYQRGLVVGETTFGKAVGFSYEITDYGLLHKIALLHYDVSGKCYNASGVIPDITIPNLAKFNSLNESLVPYSKKYADIPPLKKFKPITNIPKNLLVSLQYKSDTAIAKNQYFIYVKQSNELLEFEQDSNSKVLLHLDKRQQQQIQLKARKVDIANQLLQSTGRQPVADITELNESYDLTVETDRNILLATTKIFANYNYSINNQESG